MSVRGIVVERDEGSAFKLFKILDYAITQADATQDFYIVIVDCDAEIKGIEVLPKVSRERAP